MPDLRNGILGLDIGSNSIKWVLYDNSGREPVLFEWGIIELPEGWIGNGRIINPEGIGVKLREVLESFKAKVTKASLTLACPEMIVRTAELPRLGAGELANAAKYEVKQLIPVDTQEYIADYRVLGDISRGDVKQTRVLLAAVPEAIVGEYIELFKNLGLVPQVIDFNGNGISGIVNLLQSNHTGERQVVVDAGASTTTITIVENGTPVFTRLLRSGGKDITNSIVHSFDITPEEAEKLKKAHAKVSAEQEKSSDSFAVKLRKSIMPAVERLYKDIYHSIEFYESISGCGLDSIILTGGGSQLKGLGSYLASGLELKKVSIAGVLMHLPKGSFTRQQAAVLANVLGLAFRDQKNKNRDINLLPEGYRDIKRKRRDKRARVMAGLLAAIFAVSAVAFPLYYKSGFRNKSTRIRNEIAGWDTVMQYRETRADLSKRLADREGTVLMLKSLGREWSAMLVGISSNIPKGVWLEVVNYTYGERLDVFGKASDYNTVAQFMVNLQNMESISAVQPVSIALSEEGVIGFEIRCLVRGEPDGN